MGNSFQNFEWNLVIIKDPNFLISSSINSMLQLLKEFFNFKYVVLNDVEGSGENWQIYCLQKLENSVLNIEFLLYELQYIKQLDWTDFFFFKEEPKCWDYTNKQADYPELIRQSDTTLRLVDSQYFYLYTPEKKVVELLKKNYTIENVITNDLINLDYPF